MGATNGLNHSSKVAADHLRSIAELIGGAFVEQVRAAGERHAIYAVRTTPAPETEDIATAANAYQVAIVSRDQLVEAGDCDVAELVDRHDPATEVVVCIYDLTLAMSYLGILRVGAHRGTPEAHVYFVAQDTGKRH